MPSRIDLLPGEEIVFTTSKHWVAPLRGSLVPALLLIGAFVIRLISPDADTGVAGFIGNLLDLARTGLTVAGSGWIAYNVIVWRTATFAVTNLRVMREEGLASRRSSASMLSSVTDVQTRISFLGERLGYGDLVIFGKGGEAAADRFSTISRPREFRDRLMAAGTDSAAHPASGGAQGDARTDELATLARLAELRDAGTLTVEEFEAKKSEILARI